MTDVRDAFAAAGCRNVRTYIQSVNIIFDTACRVTESLAARVGPQLRKVLGEEPQILFRTAGELLELIRRAPFGNVQAKEDAKLYVVFLSDTPRRKPIFPLLSPREALEAVAMRKREVYVFSRRKKNGFFGYPNEFIEQELLVSATTRNLSTLAKIVESIQTETTS